MNIEGGCYCGEIRYVSNGDPQASVQCHCRQCQYITGGNPNIFIMVPEEAFTYVKGEPCSFSRPDLENPVSRFFCPTCGTAIGTKAPGAPGAMVIKVGTLDDPSIFKASAAIFTKDSQPFHHIADDVPSFKEFPGL